MAESWFLTEILILSSFFFFFFFFFFLNYYMINKKSTLLISWPVVGMLPGLLANLHHFHEWATAILSQCQCSFQFQGPWFFGMDYLATSDPANVHHVFNVNFSNYPKGEEFGEIFDFFGNGIFNADADSWRRQRKKAHNLMGRPQFRAFVAECSRNKVEYGLLPFINQIAEGEIVVDLEDVFLRLTFDMTCNLVIGVDPGSLSLEFPTIPFAKAIDCAMEVVLLRHAVPIPWWKLMRRLRIGKEKKLKEALVVIDDFLERNIARRKQEQEKCHTGDLLTSYIKEPIEVDEKDSIECDDKFLRDTAFNLMIAGRDTTGVALTWFFWLLATNPRVESQILDELKNHLQGKKRPCLDYPVAFVPEELAKLVYLHAALCESLRLFPPVPFEHKGALQPEVLPSGHAVRSGTKVLFSTYSMGRMEEVWGKDCLEFKPERWISERGKLRHEPSYKFFSFNCGPRTCLGKEMAFTQMKTVVAAMVFNYEVKLVEGQTIEPALSIILRMKNGLKVRFKQRR